MFYSQTLSNRNEHMGCDLWYYPGVILKTTSLALANLIHIYIRLNNSKGCVVVWGQHVLY